MYVQDYCSSLAMCLGVVVDQTGVATRVAVAEREGSARPREGRPPRVPSRAWDQADGHGHIDTYTCN